MKAKSLFHEKTVLEDDSIVEIVVWELPQKTIDRLHGFKYRLYYGDNTGKCLVRYDNEAGKGDHKHLGHLEVSYEFVDLVTLLEDFYRNIQMCLQKRRR